MRGLRCPWREGRSRDQGDGDAGVDGNDLKDGNASENGNDSGAIAVLVAVLLSFGVLLGMGALVIDVGTLSVEREQLQSDADSAAWALAADCALGLFAFDQGQACDPAAATAAASGYAGRSAGDGAAAADATICPALCAGTGGPDHCPTTPTGVQGGVAQVRMSTLNSDGTTILPPVFGQTLDPDYDGEQVMACSQVVWGVATEGLARGLAIGLCKWQEPTAGLPRAVVSVDSTRACSSPAGPEFAWLDGTDCQAPVKVGDPVVTTADDSACFNVLAQSRDDQTPLLVPLIRDASGGEEVVGLTGFQVTDFTAHQPGDYGTLTPAGCVVADPGDPASVCVTGYFTRVVVPTPSALPGTTDDYGAAALSRIS